MQSRDRLVFGGSMNHKFSELELWKPVSWPSTGITKKAPVLARIGGELRQGREERFVLILRAISLFISHCG